MIHFYKKTAHPLFPDPDGAAFVPESETSLARLSGGLKIVNKKGGKNPFSGCK